MKNNLNENNKILNEKFMRKFLSEFNLTFVSKRIHYELVSMKRRGLLLML